MKLKKKNLFMFVFLILICLGVFGISKHFSNVPKITTDLSKSELLAVDARSGSNSFKVTFHGNGGYISGKTELVNTCQQVSCSYDMPTATRTGYKFTGWKILNGSSCINPARGVKYSNTADYYACWESTSNSESTGGLGSGTKAVTAPTTGCYPCGTSYLYYNAGATMGSTCKATMSESYLTIGSTANGSACATSVKRYVANDTTANKLGKKCGSQVTLSNCTGFSMTRECSIDGSSRRSIDGLNFAVTSANTKCTSATPSEGSTGGSTGASNPKVAVVNKSNNTANNDDTITPGDRYVSAPSTGQYYGKSNFAAQGDWINCGDKLYVTSCEVDSKAGAVCTVTKINDKNVTTTTKVLRAPLVTDPNNISCAPVVRYTAKDQKYSETDSYTSLKTDLECGTEVTMVSYPRVACTYNNGTYCKATSGGKTYYVERKTLTPGKVCDDKDEKCEATEPIKDVKDIKEVKVCYEYQNSELLENKTDLTKLVTCADDYELDGYTMSYDGCKEMSASKAVKTCDRTYSYTCKKKGSKRPGLSAAGSLLTSANTGTVSLQAYDTGSGVKGYLINSGKSVTSNDTWTPFDNDAYKASSQQSAGTYFVYAISNDGGISYPVMVKVKDNDTSTTLSQITLKNSDGTVSYDARPLEDGTTGYESDGIVDSKYVMLSNTLKNDSVIAGFDPLNTAYEVTVDKPQMAVYATLTSTDASYVPGFEPRTVDLEYGKNVILIKIVNNKGKERTYTIIANRVDDRESNNLLSDLTVSVGEINFDSYVSDYTVEVPKNTKEVSINGTLASENAAFVEGYEPRKVTVDNDATSAVLKSISEAGIVRSYIVTFVKTGTNADNDFATSTYLSSLSVPGTLLNFDRKTTSYSVSVDYATVDLPIFAFAESSKATVDIDGNYGLNVGQNMVEVTVTNGSKKKLYTVIVTRKEDGLGISSDTNLGTLTIKDYPIEFKPEVLDYIVKIKQEKTLLITATANSNRSEVYMVGNNDLTGFSTVRVKVIAENGDTKIYSIDIQKDPYNKALEITAAIIGGVLIIGAAIIIVVKKKKNKMKDYIGE